MDPMSAFKPCPPGFMRLRNKEIHVWRAFLKGTPADLRRLRSLLSDPELRKTHRFYFQKDYERYILVHGILRQILGRYLDSAPDQIRFQYGSYGKPFVADQPDHHTLHFNVSYSEGIALFAFTVNRRIGIDIERIRSGIAQEQIAERFFSPGEVAALRSLPASHRPGAFFSCWTRKEAIVKARGVGLSAPLDQFEVTLTPGEPAALLQTRWDPSEINSWELRALHPAKNFSAAIATEGLSTHLKCWHWNDNN